MNALPLPTLLPINATPIERAIEQATVPSDNADAIRPAYRPGAIPEATLPWLAWAFDVPLWPSDQAERRGIGADSWRLHRLRGTMGGLKAIAKYAGGEVVKAITPPAKSYVSPALTRAERNAFVARYPQLRIYRFRTQGKRIGLHCGDTIGLWLPVQSDAVLRIAPRAYFYKDGIETELTMVERKTATTSATAESRTVTEVSIPGAAGRLSFAASFPRFLTVTEAARRFYRVTLQQTYQDSSETLRKQTAEPGLQPIDINPDAIAQAGQAAGVHAGQFVARHMLPSSASDRIFQRLYLFDPAVEVIRRAATMNLNAGRLGLPAHHAELSLRVPGRRHKLATWAFVRGHLVASDQGVLMNCLGALRNMARASDRLSIDTAIQRPALAGESVLAGHLVAGQWTL